MSFADPQPFTINGVLSNLARIGFETTKNGVVSTYANADETLVAKISHQRSGTRVRSQVRLDQKKIVTNPVDQSTDYDTLSFYFVIDRPDFGFSLTEVQYLVAALELWVDNTSIGKLYGKES